MRWVLLFTTLVILSLVATAVAQNFVQGEIVSDLQGYKIFGVLGNPQIPLGGTIVVKVTVKNTGSVPFTPKINVILKDPDGNTRYNKNTTFTKLDPGDSDTYSINTGVVADKEGSWGAWITLYDANTGKMLDFKLQGFDVVANPEGKISSIEITTLAATAGLSILVGYGLNRLMVK